MTHSWSALVLAAGLGTRLYPLTLTRAKPAAPVANVPIVERILRSLAAAGVNQAVLNLHHRPETIARIVGDGAQFGIRVRYSWEHPAVLGSAGGPRLALPLLDTPRFLLVNGDTLSDASAADLIAEHTATRALVTMTVVRNRWPDHYGGVLVNDDGAVTGFTRRGDHAASWHFIGLQAVETSVFEPLPPGVPAESVNGIYRALIEDRPGTVRAWRVETDFVDVGTPADCLRASLAMATREGGAVRLIGARCEVAPSARLHNCVLWDDVQVGDDVELDSCIVADGARITAGARYSRCALAPLADRTRVPSFAHHVGDLVIVPFDAH